jgi:hypothetical protein
MTKQGVESVQATAEDVARGERLLTAVKEAFPNIEVILKTTTAYSADRMTAPPLLKTGYNWDVDPETFKQFKSMVNFLNNAIFGVDCDSDPAVLFRFVDRSREENFLPSVRVPRVRDHGSLAKRYQQLSLAEMNLASAQTRVNDMRRMIDRDLRELVEKEDRKSKAQDCDTCKGKGWVKTDQATWRALSYTEQCRTRAIGCNVQEGGEHKVYRLFCECQKEEAGDGGD